MARRLHHAFRLEPSPKLEHEHPNQPHPLHDHPHPSPEPISIAHPKSARETSPRYDSSADAAAEHEPARAHITRVHRPASEDELRVSRVAEAWAAVSVSLVLISFVGIAMFQREHLISMLVFSIALFAFVEAGFRGRLIKLISSVNIGLAVVATLILVYEFFWQLVVAAVLILGLYVLWDNLRELRRR
jgi:hypothetical protein